MENQQEMVDHYHQTTTRRRQEFMFSERNRKTPSQGRVFILQKTARVAQPKKALFPPTQWTNRGENDGLDYFL